MVPTAPLYCRNSEPDTANMPPTTPDANVKTALRVLEIIETFAREQKPLSLTQIARDLSAPVSSCQALLKTLINLGYVYETGGWHAYYPTGRLLAMAERISRCDPVLENILPNLRDLHRSINETILFSKLSLNKRVILLHSLESTYPVRYSEQPGAQSEPHASPTGHALLSTLDPSERRRLLTEHPLVRYTRNTMTDPAEIEVTIQSALVRGWFSDTNRASPGEVGAISWPMRLTDSQYALTVAGPLARIATHETN
ncbi:MAG: IclR family transcriptional regulator, partial [Candidimonas sp.]